MWLRIINNVLNDKELLFSRVSQVLSDNGMFSYNGAYVNDWNNWLKEILDEFGGESDFLEKLTMNEIEKRDELKSMLSKYFCRVESVLLPNNWHYSEADDLFEKLLNVYPQHEKFLRKTEKLLKQYFADKIDRDGEIVVTIHSQFWHCYR